ncbi:hypothetical protein TNCV_2907871 [Trichonephila clavipes]|nr:hypothetical protein TNCV_2907871 [Trichonephila clavipes]
MKLLVNVASVPIFSRIQLFRRQEEGIKQYSTGKNKVSYEHQNSIGNISEKYQGRPQMTAMFRRNSDANGSSSTYATRARRSHFRRKPPLTRSVVILALSGKYNAVIVLLAKKRATFLITAVCAVHFECSPPFMCSATLSYGLLLWIVLQMYL